VDLEATFLDQSELAFDLALDPASLVSEAQASAAFAGTLVPQVSQVPFLIAAPGCHGEGEAAHATVRVTGAVVYPNLETWLQPLIEALSGADRLLVSPSLVGSIRVATRRPDQDAGVLSVAVTYPADRLLAKTPLRVITL
jgi:hypothetical protein